MNAKFSVLAAILLVATVSTAACAPAEGKSSNEPVPTQTARIVIQEVTAAAPAATSTQVLGVMGPQSTDTVSASPTPAPQATAKVAKVTGDPFAGYEACPYKDTGSPQPEKVSVAAFSLPDGRHVYAVDLASLPGCAIVFEGRFPWQTTDQGLAETLSQTVGPWDPWDVHFIVDVRSVLGAFDPTSLNLEVGVRSEYQHWLVYSEGSFWFYDPTWNISNLKSAKPSIAQELEAKKFRDAMTPGEYNDPRVIMQPNGTQYLFWQTDSGDAAYANGTAASCTKTGQPEMIPVYGLWNGSEYSAAIGAGNCKMAYWADESDSPVVWNGYQKDGKTIVTYKTSVVAYMFPASWDDSQVNTWVADHPGGK